MHILALTNLPSISFIGWPFLKIQLSQRVIGDVQPLETDHKNYKICSDPFSKMRILKSFECQSVVNFNLYVKLFEREVLIFLKIIFCNVLHQKFSSDTEDDICFSTFSIFERHKIHHRKQKWNWMSSTILRRKKSTIGMKN